MEPNGNTDKPITDDSTRVSNVFELHTINDKKDHNESESMHTKHHYWKAFLGITMGLLSGASLAISDVFALLCVKIGYSPSQVLLVKSLMMMAITIPLLVYRKINILKLKRKDTILNIVKSCSENAGDVLFYYSMDGIGMGDATSIAAGTLPIFAPMFACVFIQEKCKPRDCIGIAINVAGIILISRPEFIFGTAAASSDLGYMYAVAAGLLVSTGAVCAKAMSDDLSLIVVVFYNGLFGFVIMLIFVYPTSSDRIYTFILEYPITTAYLVGMVALFLAYLYSFNRSLQLQSVGKTSILTNDCLVVSFIADVVVFHQELVSLELIGAALIILSSILVFVFTWLETRHTLEEEAKLLQNPK
ncbi:solute carrier family 35 member G1-like [Saccoglossus kowalevskii]|uniref:Solute carrier family 35 member G1-like n=1 Tax=Saccoglossus kowalevskii TaxID=10224 RepID=A0ABM0MWZ7_SACKO|nr:PREDICTED: solute carrier family 35 member G1-like [Saccoglossus kowalevskii]